MQPFERLDQIAAAVHDPAAAEAQIRTALAEELGTSRLSLWRPGNPIASTGARLLVGVSPVWNGYDRAVLVELERIARGAGSDDRIEIFVADDCTSGADIEMYIPGLAGATTLPLLGLWKDGRLETAVHGPRAYQLLAARYPDFRLGDEPIPGTDARSLPH